MLLAMLEKYFFMKYHAFTGFWAKSGSKQVVPIRWTEE